MSLSSSVHSSFFPSPLRLSHSGIEIAQRCFLQSLASHSFLTHSTWPHTSHKNDKIIQVPKPTQPTGTPPQGQALVGALRVAEATQEDDRQTLRPTHEGCSTSSVTFGFTPHAQRPHPNLHPSALCKAGRPAAPTSRPRAACVITARRCSKRRAQALAAAGSQARAAGRVERSAVWAAGRRWAGARGQVRGRPSPRARPKLCKCPGRIPGLPLEWAGLREGPDSGGSTGWAAVSAPREIEATVGRGSSWLWGPPADISHAW